jgi:hypothetical protein
MAMAMAMAVVVAVRHRMVHILFGDVRRNVGGNDYFLDFTILPIGGTELIQIEY